MSHNYLTNWRREYLVDLMAGPGTLLPADVLSVKDASGPKPLNSLSSGASSADSICHIGQNSISGKMESLSSSPSTSNDMGADPSRASSHSNPYNQLDLSSTSAVGASLFKPHRGALTIGDGNRLNVNVVPYNQGTSGDARNLFAELNPFILQGSGQASLQNKSQYEIDESQRFRNDAVHRIPPSPLMWKNN